MPEVCEGTLGRLSEGESVMLSTHKVEVVSDEPETVVNEKGGKQAHIATRLTLFPHRARLKVGEILSAGAKKYGAWNWLLIDRDDHLDHAQEHLELLALGDTKEDHLANAACRILFALEKELESREKKDAKT